MSPTLSDILKIADDETFSRLEEDTLETVYAETDEDKSV